MRPFFLILLVVLVAVALPGAQARAQSALLTVNLATDNGDGVCDASCTLRDAILAANDRAGPNKIVFAIGSGPVTIRPRSPLPLLEDSFTTIDGTTQPGGGVAPRIYLDGAGVPDASGLVAVGADIQIRGIAVGNWVRYGLAAIGETALRTRFIANWAGMGIDGRGAAPNQLGGIVVLAGATNARVGETCTGCGNRVAGNRVEGRTGHGVVVGGNGTVGAVVQNNVIGLDADGRPLPNDDGVLVVDGAQASVGGRFQGEGNTISGNRVAGVEVRDNQALVAIRIEGNRIGTNEAGTAAAGNDVGVFINGQARKVTVGGNTSFSGNVISGNRVGVAVEQLAQDVTVAGNLIGLSANGGSVIANTEDGISVVAGANGVTIGGVSSSEANWIAGNGNGIVVADATTANVTVIGNRIGLLRNGSTAAPNDTGIAVLDASSIVIGSANPAAANVIVGTRGSGIVLDGVERPEVRGNRIGLLPDDRPLGNGAGITLQGGTTEALIFENRIGGNRGAGIVVLDQASRRNRLGRNVFLANDGIGIDLGGDGITANDEGDNDSGPNGLLNTPLITSVEQDAGIALVSGSGPPGARVEVYRISPLDTTVAPHPSGFGAGGGWVGVATVEEDGTWQARLGLSPGTPLTALSVSSSGDTSEFSANFIPEPPVRLPAGLTPVAWPGPELPVAEAFSGIGSRLQAAFRFNTARGAWDVYRPGLPPQLSTLAAIQPGDALWLALTPGGEFHWFPPRREDAPRTLSLAAGLNFVTWSGPATPFAEAIDPILGTLQSAFVWQPQSRTFALVHPALPGRPAPAPLTPGSLLWVRLTLETEWPQPAQTSAEAE